MILEAEKREANIFCLDEIFVLAYIAIPAMTRKLMRISHSYLNNV